MADAHYDYLIIGGGIAGTTAAETIRGRDAASSIAILSAEPHPLYSRVLLPGYLKARIGRERVFLRSAGDYAAKKIDFYPASEARAADAARREITTADNQVFHFGKLLIASGGRVRPWQYEDAVSPHAYRLQTINDADRLVRDLPHIKNPLVIGSSFIALEFVEVFLAHGIVPRVLAQAEGFFSACADKEGSKILEDNFRQHGVSCLFSAAITACRRDGDDYAVDIDGGDTLRTDAVVLGIGIERNRDFLKNSDIALGKTGIKTDEYLETSAKDIYAAGDIAEYYDPLFGEYRTGGNWGHAVAQGTRVAHNMMGEHTAFTRAPSYSITNCGMQIAAIGECGGEGVSGITRRGGGEHEYERLFMRHGILVGAFLINRPSDRAIIADLINRRTNMGSYERDISAMAFDMSTVGKIL